MLFGKPLDVRAEQWRVFLEMAVEPVKDKPLFLSGGMDSVTIAAAAVALGGSPPCYTFRLAGGRLPDFKNAERVAGELGLTFNEIVIPRDVETAVEDIRRVGWLLPSRDWVKKTVIQCGIPFLYLADAVRKDGFDSAITGMAAICSHLGEGMWRNESELAKLKYRTKQFFDVYANTADAAIVLCSAAGGIALFDIYRIEPLRSFGLTIDFAEMNRPRQKGIALRSYPEFFNRGFWRENESLQIGSGLREFHDVALINDEAVNTFGVKESAALYRRLMPAGTFGVERAHALEFWQAVKSEFRENHPREW